MKKDIEKFVEIPPEIEVEINKNKVKMKSKEKELSKEFNIFNIKIEKKENKIIVSSKNATRRESKMIGTIIAHLKNMIKGLTEGFTYKLEICYVHFPMTVSIEGNEVIIKSFFGEKIPRKAKILPEANVEINGNQIIVTSHNIEAAGQTAANIEKATKLKGRDRRIFQDGIFITEKPKGKI